MTRQPAYVEDDLCEGCGRSIAARFPGAVPSFCEACDDEFRRELKAGHVTYGGEVVYPAAFPREQNS